jgi:Icc-related predicted phosphoesterase
MKIIYASDIHASSHHLFTMLSTAEREAVDAIIIGGDIVPHYLPDADTIGVLKAQAIYLENVFIPAIEGFKRRWKAAIYIDFANDDFIGNRKILEKHNGELIHLLHMSKHNLNNKIDIIGYMNVPPTPFYRKDWEKPDSIETPFAKGNYIRKDGYTSAGGKLEKTVLNLSSDDTIEKDLAQLSEIIDKHFIFVSHSPPYDTPLDILDNGLHVGSISVRKFIEKWALEGKIIAALHGHIHGSPNRSGSIRTFIENSLCINPGQNEGEGATLRYVIFELDDKQSFPAIRIVYEPKLPDPYFK